MHAGLKRVGLAFAALLLGGIMAVPYAAGKDQAYTGQVSDAMCGAHHMMEGGDAACTRACVSKGSKYALVSGDKVYTLETSDKAALGQLDKLAGAKAKVMGSANGDTITVTSVAPAK